MRMKTLKESQMCLLAVQNLLEYHGVAHCSGDLQKVSAEFAMTLARANWEPNWTAGPKALLPLCFCFTVGSVTP